MNAISRKLTIWSTLAWGAILESIRRKDMYVALILSVVMIGGAAVVGTFGVDGLEMFLKDVALTVVNLLSILMTILFASRQIPEELSRRTVYPLLARPISRGDLVFGKFLGAYALATLCLLLFALVAWISLARYGLSMGPIFGQFLLLRWFSLGILCALTILLSLLLTPNATITIALLLSVGASTFSQAILLLDGPASAFARTLMRGAYFVFPHLDLFDLSKKVSYGWKPVAIWAIAGLAVYAIVYVALFLNLSVLRFRRQGV